MSPATPQRPPGPRQTPAARVDAVRAAVAARGPGPFTVATPAGPVTINGITITDDGVVEVEAPGFADPHLRIINPPRFVPDPAGDVLINGHPFREDALAALAHVIAQHGGRLKDPRRGPT